MAGWGGNDAALGTEIPQWAIRRAEELCGCNFYSDAGGVVVAFARYIMKHEQPPVDPDVLAARQLIADVYGRTRFDDGRIMIGDSPPRVEAITAGNGDEYWEMRAVIAALKSRKRKEAGK